jgi:hypothetical protein
MTMSVPVSMATLAFRLADDYPLVPKIVGKAVPVSAVATLVLFPRSTSGDGCPHAATQIVRLAAYGRLRA